MNSMSAEAVGESAEPEGGPMWGRFFDSLGGQDDTESALSGSHIPPDAHAFQHKLSQLQQSPSSEVHPNDSASVVDDEDAESALAAYPKKRAALIPSVMGTAASLPVDDGTYVFKFRTPSGRTHRFQARHDNVENLRDIISGKLSTDPFFVEFNPIEESAPRPDPSDFVLSYTDADGDTVVITSDTDVTDAVKIARSAKTDRVVLFIQGGKGWSEAGPEKSEAKAAEVNAVAQQQEKEVVKAEATLPEGVTYTPPNHVHVPQDEIFGMPKELLLPASIGVLAVVIVGVFAISRMTRDNF
jgi:PB1 domain